MSDPFTGPEGGKLGKELEAIVGVANKSIQTIAPWRGVSTRNPKLEEAIQQIQGYSLQYFGAIDTSIQTAQDSYSLSSDIIDLCGYLADPETDQNELQDFVAGVQRNVKRACEVSTKTLSQFEEARKTLNEMSNKLPKEVTTKDGSLAKLWGRVAFFGQKDAAQRDEELDTAIAGLKLEVLDISVLSKSIDSFEKWCKVMDNTMKEAESGVRELSTTSGSQQVEKLRKNWTCIQKDYEQYKTQVLKFQDQYSAQVVTHAPAAFSLSELEMNTPHKILNSIVESAYKSMEIIEPWSRASSDHAVLSKMIEDIHTLGLSYYSAIDISVKTAQDGYGFSNDALQLCELLLDSDTNVNELQEYIKDMKDKANHAHSDSKETLDKFRNVRKSLNEITARAPQELVESDRAKSLMKIPFFDRKSDKRRDAGLIDALDELNMAAINLGTLSESVDLFAKWWTDMETVLSNIGRNAGGLRPGKDKVRVKQLRTNWTRIQEDYSQYKTKIIQLQDYYPSQRIETRAPKAD